LLMHVAERPGNERTRPVGVTRGRFRVEKRQDAARLSGPYFGAAPRIAGLVEACEAIPRITHPPFGDYADRAPNFTGNRTCRGAIRCHQSICALSRVRYSVFVERTRLSSSARSSGQGSLQLCCPCSFESRLTV
jgi:hypothetical protein